MAGFDASTTAGKFVLHRKSLFTWEIIIYMGNHYLHGKLLYASMTTCLDVLSKDFGPSDERREREIEREKERDRDV